MLTVHRLLRLPWAVWLALAALGTATALLASAEDEVTFTGVPQLQLQLPLPEPALLPEADAAGTGFAALVEDGAFGPLPRVADDGRRPLVAYAHPFNRDDQRPRIALLVVGLGLQADLTDAAIRLPGAIGLQFSAYGADLPGMVDRARRAGHEVLLDLPMEPLDYPASDPGPHTLLAGSATEDNLQRLDWLLARATGYIAVAGGGARFATSAEARPVLAVLARRGLAMVELGRADLAASAIAVGLPYASAPVAIDEDPSVQAIDSALAGLEAEALRTGSALGVAQGYPVSLERLRLWATTLEEKGLVLAPVSALLIEGSGLQAGLRHHGETGRGSQG